MSTLSPAMSAVPILCRSILQIGLCLGIQTTVILLVALAVGLALKRRSSALQDLIYETAIVSVLGCALLTLGTSGRFEPLWRLSLPGTTPFSKATADSPTPANPNRAVPAVGVNGDAVAGHAAGESADVRLVNPANPPSPAGKALASIPPFRDFLRPDDASLSPSLVRFYTALAFVWFAGTAMLLTWTLVCYLGVRRIRRRARSVETGAIHALLMDICQRPADSMRGSSRRPPLLLISDEVRSVFLTGLFRPAILLPTSFEADFDLPTLRAVLSHEVAHLERLDNAWALLCRLLCAFGWMQPLLWLVSDRREQASEEACDLAVIRAGQTPSAYAACLVRVAEQMAPRRFERVSGVGMTAFRSSLGRRIERLLAASSRPIAPFPKALRAVLFTAMLCLVGTTTRLVSASSSPDDTWARDTRLDQGVLVSAEGISLRELLPIIASKTGVSVSASTDLADKKVIVLGPTRPLRDVLTDLAALYQGYWSHEQERDGKSRYLLLRNPGTHSYEERLANANEDRLLTQLDALVHALQETPEQLAKRSESDPIRQALSTPDGRRNAGIFALLTPWQRAQLIEQWHVSLPVSALDDSLKSQVEDLFHGDRFAPEKNDGLTITEIPREKMDRANLAFDILNASDTGSMDVYMSAPTGFNSQLMRFRADAKFVLPPHGNPYTGEKVRADSALPDPKAIQKSSGKVWPDLLRSLTEKTGVPVVSDYYRSRPLLIAAAGDEAASPDTSVGALDLFCRPQGYLWWTKGRTLFFRKRDWYNQERYEVPDRWVLTLAQHVKAQHDVPTYADLFTLQELTIEQIVGLDTSAGGSSDRRLVAGLRELIAALTLAVPDKLQPVHTDAIRDFRGSAVLWDLSDPQERTAVDAFLEASIYRGRFENADPANFGSVVHSAHRSDLGSDSIGVDFLMLVGKNSLAAGYPLALPLSLHDDRRAQTRVELVH